MRKRLTKHGNELVLVIDQPLLDHLGADANTAFEVSTEGQTLIIKPLPVSDQANAFTNALERVNKKYAGDLKKLAE